MKRFLAFAGMQYYPRRAWSDFCGDFDSYEAAMEWWKSATADHDWIQIVDTETGELAYEGSNF